MDSHISRYVARTRCLAFTWLALALLASGCDELPGRDKPRGTQDDDSPSGANDASTGSPEHDAGVGPDRDGGEQTDDMDADTPEYDAAWPEPEVPNYVRVEAESFLPGPDGYFDTTAENQGGYGSLTEGVDVGIANDSESPGSLSVGYTRPGEWLRYEFTLEKSASYLFRARVAHETGGGRLSVYVDEQLVTRFEVPGTGGWVTWAWVDQAIGALEAGAHTLKVTIDTAGLNGADAGNLNFFDFVPLEVDAGVVEPDAGSMGDAGEGDGGIGPVRLEMEDFLIGAENYSDTSPTNEGGFGRLDEAVDVGFAGDPETPGSLCIGYTKPGEWLSYDLMLPATGTYLLRARVAHESGGGDFSLFLDELKVGTFTVPSTGSWGTWMTIEQPLGRLPGGSHTLKLTVDTAGADGTDAGNVNYLEFVPLTVEEDDGGTSSDAGQPEVDAGAPALDASVSDGGAPDAGSSDGGSSDAG
jgi:hypothetical protein